MIRYILALPALVTLGVFAVSQDFGRWAERRLTRAVERLVP